MVQVIKLLISSISLVLVVALPAHAGQLDQPTILIAEIQPESATSGTEELISLYNPNDTEVDVTDWQIQYRSALATDETKWTTKATVACLSPTQPNCRVTLTPKSSLLLTSYDVGQETHKLTSGMALSGGQVRLIQKSSPQEVITHDLVGYGNAAVFEGEAAIAPQKGNSIKRLQAEDGVLIDTDNNKHDFVLSEQPEPAEPADNEAPGQGAGQTYLPLLITELLPDPASPAEDEKDEFIELYNPHDTAVVLKDYVLEAGSNWRYRFVLPDMTLPPRGYVAFSSEQTGIALSNSGTGVRLMSPTAQLLDEAANYGKAKTGQSWIRLDNNEWRWSVEPTPGSANVHVAEPPKAVTVKPAKATTKKVTATKAKAAAKPKAKSVKAAKTKDQKQTAQPAGQAANASKAPNYWLIGTVAALAGGYALYEYRHDALGRLRRIRETIKGKSSE